MFIDILIIFAYLLFVVSILQARFLFITKLVLILSIFPFCVFALSQIQFLFEDYIDFEVAPDYFYLQIYTIYFILSLTTGLYISTACRLVTLSFIDTEMQAFSFVQRFRTWEYFIFSAFLAGTFINLAHVNFTIALMFVAPRVYESIFGSNVFSNYLFFLGPLVICNIIYRRYVLHSRRWFDILAVLLCLVASALHGVKFTIIDSVLIPIFFFYSINRRTSSSYFFLSIGFISILFTLFGLYVRGGDNIVLTYVLPNFLNAAYSLNGVDYPYTGLSAILPGKLFSFMNSEDLKSNGFVFNDKFNMATGLPTTVGFLFPLGTSILSVIYFYFLMIVSKERISYISSLLFSLLHIQAMMFFFYSSVVKDKYWYLFAVPCCYILFRRLLLSAKRNNSVSTN
jgi:hypothetical protein